MTLSEAFALTSFALFSLSDLRTRLVPGIECFFRRSDPADPACQSSSNRAGGAGDRLGFVSQWLRLSGPAAPVLSSGLAGAADRLRPPARSGGESGPAGDCRAGLPAAPACRAALPVRPGSLAQTLAAAQVRSHPGPARTAFGLAGLPDLAPAPVLATASHIPLLQKNIMPVCRAPEPWAIPSPTFTLAPMLACPSGVAA